MEFVGALHTQLGPVIKALVMSNGDIESTTKTQVEKVLDTSPFDSTAAKIEREKKSIVYDGLYGSNCASSSSLVIDIPKTDLVATLPPKCLTRMVSSVESGVILL